jgi:excisionase family DNA binding protein
MARLTKAIRGKKLTSSEAARALGVSEASVKRWADSGLLPMEKTAGGHRRFRPEDVAVVRRAGLGEEESRPLKKRSAAGLNATVALAEIAPDREAALVEETFRVLMDGRGEELSSLLINLHLQGQSVGAIADRFLCAAMRRVGELWHAGQISVAQEHVATCTANVALQRLQAVLGTSEAEGRHALRCSVEDDFHQLPSQLAALTLEAGGFKVFDLGTSTPFSALAEAVERFRPRLVCVTSTILFRLDRAAREYADFHQAARRSHTSIVLGGAGFADAEVRGRLPADLHAESFRQLEEFIGAHDSGES